MKTGNVFLGALLLVALAACDRDGAATTDTDDTMPASPATVTAPAAMEPPVTDPATAGPDAQTGQAEALALLVAVNEHEIAAAEQARAKSVDGDVLEFANLMDTEHSANLEQTRALMGGAATGADSAEVAAQRAKGEAELARLGALDGDAYEDAYVDAMVAGHDEVLRMLDGKLIPAAQDNAVRQHFTTTRGHVAAHLEKARALQAD